MCSSHIYINYVLIRIFLCFNPVKMMFLNQWICSVNVDVSVFLSQRSRPCALCWMPSAWSTGRTCLSTRSVPLNQSSTSGLTLCYFFSSPVGPVLSPKYFSAFRPRCLKKAPSISSQYKLSSILRELCEDCCDTALLDFFPSHLLEAKIHPQMFLQQQCGGGEIRLPGNWTAVKQDIARKQFCDVCARWRSFQIAVFTLRLEPAFPLMLADAVPVHFTVKHSQLTYCVVFN